MDKEKLGRFWSSLIGFHKGDRVKYQPPNTKTFYYGDVLTSTNFYVWVRIHRTVIWLNPESLIKVQRRTRRRG